MILTTSESGELWLQAATCLSEEQIKSLLDNSDLTPETARMKLVLGLWCSRGLSSLRAPCEVFQKVRILTSKQSPALILTDNEETVEFCNILDCSDYSDLHQSLSEGEEELKSPLEVAAAYILGQNIRVARLAVESEENVFTESLQGILRRDLSRDFPADMKVGRWSQRDQRTVLKNLSELQHQLSLSSEDFHSILDNSPLTHLERNGRYPSQHQR